MSVLRNGPPAALIPALRKGLLGLAVVAALVGLYRLRDRGGPDDKVPGELFHENRSDASEPLAPGIPRDRIPDYTLDGFEFVSTASNQKQWKLQARQARVYNAERISHTLDVTAYLYDAQGQATVVTGLEGKHHADSRELEVFGQVRTVFPDGFELHSDYLRYRPGPARRIDIPERYLTHGRGKDSAGERQIEFTSQGLEYELDSGELTLPRRSVVEMATLVNGVPASRRSAAKDRDHTRIESDRAVIYRARQFARFTMSPTRPLHLRFVQITQPTLIAQARRAELRFGPDARRLDYLSLFEDVFLRELPREQVAATPAAPVDPEATRAAAPPHGGDGPVRYATGGRADFDGGRDVIVLRDFPQVYQDQDTVTGEVIVVHRESDIVEVEHSNAFSEGEPRRQ